MHFALVCPPYASHLAAFDALAEALQARGHRVSFLLYGGAAHAGAVPEAAILPSSGSSELASIRANAARAGSLWHLLPVLRDGAAMTRRLCREGPALLRGAGVDALLVDQMEPAGGLLARHLGLPYLSVACALPIDAEPALPPPFLDWPCDPSPKGIKRNRGGRRVADLLLYPQRRAIVAAARALNVPGVARLDDCLSPLGTLSQTVSDFDFPRQAGRIHAVGPFRRVRKVALLKPRMTTPLVYASLGTMQGHRLDVFSAIASGCKRLGLRLALAHCGGLTDRQAASLDASLVTDFLDQPAILRQAGICVTHGGLNTALDALEAGVPMLAIPIAFDQPGVAARIVHHGAGLMLPPRKVTADRVEQALRRLLTEPAFRRNAEALGARVAGAGGAAEAARLAETLLCGSARPPMDLAG